MTIKKKKLFKKRIVILFVLVACLLIFTLIVNPKNQEDKKLTPASKTFVQTDRKGKYDYVLMKTGDVNQMTIGAYQGCEIVSFYNALVYLDKTQGRTVTDWIESLPYVGWGGDPGSGYAGNPWTSDEDIPDGGFPTIWPTALMSFAQENNIQVADLSGKSISEIKDAVLSEHLVEMWVTIDFDEPNITYDDYYAYKVVANTHAVILDGYNEKKNEFHVTDPIKGKYWLAESTVDSVYSGTNQFAIEFL
ncbi:hypothetical protein EFO15_10000 [Lactococcus lactis]|uniref:C39 family peptidase n=1 Tax=Lactococcus lactis TaxID=1358 RepID=UPI0021A5F805|nr:C39 family peptidase [Lactococcus lactis]MCT3108965.1 hypothetical protein [Lactococcus lactis]